LGSSQTSKLANPELNLSLFKAGGSLYDGTLLGSVSIWFNTNDSLYFVALNEAFCPRSVTASKKTRK